MNWYDLYLTSENNSMTKEAGMKENMASIMFAISLILGGTEISEAANKASVDKNQVEIAMKDPKIVDSVKKRTKRKKLPPTAGQKANFGPLDVVARTLYDETRGESMEGKIAVASIIYNRANGNSNGFSKVSLKPYQFSGWNESLLPRGTGASWEECLEIARTMFKGTFTPTLPMEYKHFYNPAKANPKWAYDKGRLREFLTIGHHRFMKNIKL